MIPLDVWNARVLDIVQALCGSVSSNFRRVTLANDAGVWRIHITLEREDQEDREEIEEIATAFDALQATNTAREFEIEVTNVPLRWPEPPTRVIYSRREPYDR